jgi:hypothetical protein
VGQLDRLTSEMAQIQAEIVMIDVQSRLLQRELDSYVAGGMCTGKRLKVQGVERVTLENVISKLQADRPTHEARLRDKKQQVDTFKGSMRQAMPSYWEQTMALSSDHGYALHEVNAANNGETYQLLQRFLHTTKPKELGQGRDVKWAGTYTKLELQRAWRIEHPGAVREISHGSEQGGQRRQACGKVQHIQCAEHEH